MSFAPTTSSQTKPEPVYRKGGYQTRRFLITGTTFEQLKHAAVQSDKYNYVAYRRIQLINGKSPAVIKIINKHFPDIVKEFSEVPENLKICYMKTEKRDATDKNDFPWYELHARLGEKETSDGYYQGELNDDEDLYLDDSEFEGHLWRSKLVDGKPIAYQITVEEARVECLEYNAAEQKNKIVFQQLLEHCIGRAIEKDLVRVNSSALDIEITKYRHTDSVIVKFEGTAYGGKTEYGISDVSQILRDLLVSLGDAGKSDIENLQIVDVTDDMQYRCYHMALSEKLK